MKISRKGKVKSMKETTVTTFEIEDSDYELLKSGFQKTLVTIALTILVVVVVLKVENEMR